MTRILERYVFKEITITWVAVTVVLLVIMVANVLVRTLSRVADGSVDPQLLLALVGIKSINLLVTLIPLGLYLGVLLGFGRLYRDGEMAAISACATGLRSIYRPALNAGFLGVLVIALLTFWVSPWAASYERVLAERMASRSVAGLLSAGRFVEILKGDAVVFTESLSEDSQRLRRVFVHREFVDGSFEVETADYAVYQQDESTADEFIVFVDGTATAGLSGDAQFRTTEFKQHGIKLPSRDGASGRQKISTFSLSQLWRANNSRASAEFQWRVSIPLAAALLALLAVPLSHTSPRQGRYSKIALAILIYVPYANLLVLSRKWIASGVLSPVIGLWWVHLLMLLLTLVLIARLYGWSWLKTVWPPQQLRLVKP